MPLTSALTALQRYLQLAKQDDGEKLPVPAKAIAPGSPYHGTPRLTRFLRLVGDLPAEAVVPADSKVYEGPLVDAVKRFQDRHGLATNGRLDELTLRHLNTPLSERVDQLRLTLERWHWLPNRFDEPPIIVNIPEFPPALLGQRWKHGAQHERDCGEGLPSQDAGFRGGHEVRDLPPVLECPAEHPTVGECAGHSERSRSRRQKGIRGRNNRRTSDSSRLSRHRLFK